MEPNEMDNSLEEDVAASNEATHRLNFDVVEKVQTLVHERENPIEGSQGKTPDPVVGMEFETEDQAYEFYNEYAEKVGFTIRKTWFNKTKNGTVKRRKLCCSREGLRKEDKRDANVKQHRDLTRCNCDAHMLIALQSNGKFAIVSFEATHNHQCTPKKALIFGSQRQITVAENVGLLPINYSYLQSKRLKSMVKGDLGILLQYLQRMLVEDPGSFYAIQLDEDDQITNIFWADSNMVNDYHAFGDVVCFDTTYRANNYDRPFAPFVGVNHHKQTVVFGAALMYDETSDSFQWVFKAFLDAMSGKMPTTILMDQDKVMANAISVVMPNTYHRICAWHVYQNTMKHLSSIFTRFKSFSEDFGKCIYECDEEVDFFDAWEKMLEKYNLQENTWLRWLFDERDKWAVVYERNIFCADMKSTLRSEAMNVIFKRYLHRSNNLLQFFSQFEIVVSDRRKAEAQADFKMTQSTPVLLMEVPILIGARNVYTPEIFKLFQKEYEDGMNCTAAIHCEVGTIITYKVHSRRKKRDYIVTFDSLHCTVECCCKKFEFSGILCGHVLRVIDRAGLIEVPNRYILKRWTKDAKVSTVNTSALASENKRAISSRYRELMHKSMKLNTKAAITPEAFVLAMEGIDNTMAKLDHLDIQLDSNSASQCISSHDMGAESVENATSSVSSQAKGIKRKEKGLKGHPRKKSRLEKSMSNTQVPTPSVSLANACLPLSLMCPTPSSDLFSQAYQMNPCMNQQDQHHLTTSQTNQESSVFGVRPLNEEGAQFSTCSNRNAGSALSDIRMGRPPWFP